MPADQGKWNSEHHNQEKTKVLPLIRNIDAISVCVDVVWRVFALFPAQVELPRCLVACILLVPLIKMYQAAAGTAILRHVDVE